MRGALFALIAAFLGMSLLFSCKGKPHDPAHVTAIDSMLIQVDSLESLVNAIEVPVYLQMDSTFRTQKDRLENVMKDTLDRAQAMAVGNYFRAMTGSLGRVGNMYDETLRDLADTRGEIGLSGHWAKLMLHHLFIHKAKARLGWQLIPE